MKVKVCCKSHNAEIELFFLQVVVNESSLFSRIQSVSCSKPKIDFLFIETQGDKLEV